MTSLQLQCSCDVIGYPLEYDGDEMWQTVPDAYRRPTGNVWSPMVECFDRGMMSAAVFDDRAAVENRHRRD